MLNFSLGSLLSSAVRVGLAATVCLFMGSLAIAAPPCKGNQSTTTHAVSQQTAKPKSGDIVETAVGAGSFKTLAAALAAAGLVETLKGPGPFTVFAPTDEAFAKLPQGTVETLLKPENKAKLKAILLLHVVPGTVYAADVVKLKDAKTAGGGTPLISTDGGVKVGTASGTSNVVKTDIKATNGVIHVVDAVILP